MELRVPESSLMMMMMMMMMREDREPQFLFQRISVAIQRFNAVLLHDGFLSSDHPD